MAKVQSIPVEIILIVARYLDSQDLNELALVSHACEHAANTRLFRSIRIRLESPYNWQGEIQRWTFVLYRRDSFRHVRRVELLDHRHDDDPEAQDAATGCTHVTRRFCLDDDAAYVSVLHPFRSLPALHDLVWASDRLFPRSLLKELDYFGARCRLHIRNFHLPTWAFKARQLPDVFAHAEALAASPSLSSIWVRCCKNPSTPFNNSMATLLSMVQDLSPFLKGVCVLQPCPPPIAQRPWPQPLMQRPLFFEAAYTTSTPTTKGSLASLEIEDTHLEDRQSVACWFSTMVCCQSYYHVKSNR